MVDPEGARLERLVGAWFASRVGAFAMPVLAAIVAFLVGGVVVAATGHNPLGTYKAIFEGSGLNWFWPFLGEAERALAASNLQQTLLITTPLILTGLAVAFAFRCGLFNIGGQGQYLVGVVVAVYVGTHLGGTPRAAHVALVLGCAIAAGAVYGGIAGALRATVGAHEVITTIMLNWIALFGGMYLFEVGGPLQGPQPGVPRSGEIVDSAQLWPIWGTFQPLHAGIFMALLALAVYHVVLNRTTLGFEVRAVGFNPEAARYGGISVRRNYVLALAISGSFAGLAGAIDIAGWKFRVATNDFAAGELGFIGIAVALLGRNKAAGILLAALLFGGLTVGTSARQLDPSVFPPQLASDLRTLIQALIILFIGTELVIVHLLGLHRRVSLSGPRRLQAKLRR